MGAKRKKKKNKATRKGGGLIRRGDLECLEIGRSEALSNRIQ